MKLELLVKDSGSLTGKSPTLFRSESGDYYIQGYIVASDVNTAASAPEGETLVKVSPTFLSDVAKFISK